jgi:hypothetical protein
MKIILIKKELTMKKTKNNILLFLFYLIKKVTSKFKKKRERERERERGERIH